MYNIYTIYIQYIYNIYTIYILYIYYIYTIYVQYIYSHIDRECVKPYRA